MEISSKNEPKSLDISDIVGEDVFLRTPIKEDKDIEEKIFNFLKERFIWSGTLIHFESAKIKLGIEYDTYGLYSDSRDYVSFDGFMTMLYHNPKAYTQAAKFIKEQNL